MDNGFDPILIKKQGLESLSEEPIDLNIAAFTFISLLGNK